MSAELLAEISDVAVDVGVEACWRQWAALGAPVSSDRIARGSVIDPEALVLHTLLMAHHERRLRDLLGWWARVGSRHLSVARMESISTAFPEEAAPQVGHFAYLARQAGDRSWKRLSEKPSWLEAVRDKGSSDPTLTESAALMVRLRAGFGVGIKADLLTVLIGSQGRRVPVRTLAQATGYTQPPLREAAKELTRAEFIYRTDERPVRYYVDRGRWAFLLGDSRAEPCPAEMPELPVWRFWPPVFAFLCTTIWHVRELRARQATDYVAASTLRDVFEKHRGAFQQNEISILRRDRSRGEDFLGTFADILQALARWIDGVL